MKKAFNKLVRDNIPEIIKSDGKTCITEVLSADQYLKMLDAKLNEELTEYLESKSWKNWPIFWRLCGRWYKPGAGPGRNWSGSDRRKRLNGAVLKRNSC